MTIFRHALSNHVVTIDLYFFVYHIMKQSCHRSLIISSTFQSEGHDPITESSPRYDEQIFSLSFRALQIWLQLDKPSMKENKALSIELSIRTSMWGKENHPSKVPCLNVYKQCTFSLTIFSRHRNYVEKPFWIIGNLKKTSFQLFDDLLFYFDIVRLPTP